MLDLRGTGDSGIPGDPATYRCDRQVDDVEALRDHFGWDSVKALAGWAERMPLYLLACGDGCWRRVGTYRGQPIGWVGP
ncbi:hypothetical protein GCM10020000_80130 [Streptomyces olivoverticillatus]